MVYFNNLLPKHRTVPYQELLLIDGRFFSSKFQCNGLIASFETLVASTAWKDCPSEDLVSQIVGEMETRLPAAELRRR